MQRLDSSRFNVSSLALALFLSEYISRMTLSLFRGKYEFQSNIVLGVPAARSMQRETLFSNNIHAPTRAFDYFSIHSRFMCVRIFIYYLKIYFSTQEQFRYISFGLIDQLYVCCMWSTKRNVQIFFLALNFIISKI